MKGFLPVYFVLYHVCGLLSRSVGILSCRGIREELEESLSWMYESAWVRCGCSVCRSEVNIVLTRSLPYSLRLGFSLELDFTIFDRSSVQGSFCLWDDICKPHTFFHGFSGVTVVSLGLDKSPLTTEQSCQLSGIISWFLLVYISFVWLQ